MKKLLFAVLAVSVVQALAGCAIKTSDDQKATQQVVDHANEQNNKMVVDEALLKMQGVSVKSSHESRTIIRSMNEEDLVATKKQLQNFISEGTEVLGALQRGDITLKSNDGEDKWSYSQEIQSKIDNSNEMIKMIDKRLVEIKEKSETKRAKTKHANTTEE